MANKKISNQYSKNISKAIDEANNFNLSKPQSEKFLGEAFGVHPQTIKRTKERTDHEILFSQFVKETCDSIIDTLFTEQSMLAMYQTPNTEFKAEIAGRACQNICSDTRISPEFLDSSNKIDMNKVEALIKSLIEEIYPKYRHSY